MVTRQRTMTIAHYNLVLKHLEVYREVNRQLPNLLWLLTYLLKQGVKFEAGNVLAQCREHLINEGVSKSGWRLLCNSRISQLGWIPSCKNLLSELKQYLCLHQTLRRRCLLSPKITYLFDHPEWDIDFDAVYYRSIRFPPQLMNKYIDEVVRLHKSGYNSDMASAQTALVLAWLRIAEPTIDHVQLKKPWSWFKEKALTWYNKENAKKHLSAFRWDDKVGHVEIGKYQFSEVIDAYKLMNLAERQRHCIDSYMQDCMSGDALVFDIYKANGKTEAAILLHQKSGKWTITDIRGFANKPALPSIWAAGHALVKIMNHS